MYVGPIFLPYDQLFVVLSAFATNGVISSSVVVECYTTDIVHGNARLMHAATTAKAGQALPNAYPFGTPPFQPDQGYLNPGDAGTTVYNEDLPAISNAFDADGYETSFTNEPYNTLNYQIPYDTTNMEGQIGPNIGTLPGEVTYSYPPPPPEQTNEFTNTFDPKALVIYQDFSKQDPNNPAQINRQFFSLENTATVRSGDLLFNTGQDATAPPSCSFIRSAYNENTGMMTSYYYDSWANRWLISTSPYTPKKDYGTNLSYVAPGRNTKVFEWVEFTRRVLF